MTARDKILARIRTAQTMTSTTSTQTASDHLDLHPRGPQPPTPGNLRDHFIERALKLSSDVMEADRLTDVPALITYYLDERKLPMSGVCWPSLAGLPWHEFNLDIKSRPAQNSDAVGVTGAFCAIAETGTLMMLSGPDTPASTSLLPETHIAVLDPSRIVATMEDAWDLLRKEHKQPPRAINFISGPSRTADIEQTVTLGAHGPYRVLLILISAGTQ